MNLRHSLRLERDKAVGEDELPNARDIPPLEVPHRFLVSVSHRARHPAWRPRRDAEHRPGRRPLEARTLSASSVAVRLEELELHVARRVEDGVAIVVEAEGHTVCRRALPVQR